MSWFDVKNTGKDAEVYSPMTDPCGKLTCTIKRAQLAGSGGDGPAA